MIVYRVIFDFYSPNAFQDVRVMSDDDGTILAEIAKLHTPTYTKKKTTLQKDAQGREYPEALVIRQYNEIVLQSPYGGEETVLDTGREVWFNPNLYEQADYEINGKIVKSLNFIR